MKKSIATLVIIGLALFVGSAMLTSCGSKPAEQQEQKEAEEQGEMQMDSTATAYACPMHPEERGKQGDKCSKCGMELEALKTEDTTQHEHH